MSDKRYISYLVKYKYGFLVAGKIVIKCGNSITEGKTGPFIFVMFMSISSIQAIRQFISDHHLTRIDGNILFNAEINFYNEGVLQKLTSQVQIIVLAHEIAVYIFEFLNEGYSITEMYSTGKYQFNYLPKLLEINKPGEAAFFPVSIRPV